MDNGPDEPYSFGVASPYRDELETLRRENDRLRAELARHEGPRPAWRPIAFFVVDFAALQALLPWLNAPSDAKFWGALAILLVLGAATLGFAFRRG